MALRVFTVCSGIGGIDLGFERAGCEIVGQCEVDPSCQGVLRRHFPKAFLHDDLRTLTPELVADRCGRVDVLCAGTPCQDVSSLRGSRASGLAGERSGLWSFVPPLLRGLRPRYFVFENVAAMLLHRPGRPGFGRVLADLAACGFDAEWRVLQASDFGAPHRRERLIAVAYPTGERPPDGFHGEVAPSRRVHEDWARLRPVEGRPVHAHLAAVDRRAVEEGAEPILLPIPDGVPEWMDAEWRAYGNAVVPDLAEWVAGCIVADAERGG